ncbi:hypothetical protein V2I01_30920 [Micromonospora sp. BRA006-A]|nr:hypothetical protein [Micromonospora sp. BRA006-A]
MVVTRGAVSVAADDRVSDLAGAAVWGLLRSAQSGTRVASCWRTWTVTWMPGCWVC